jgi:cyanophycinase
VLEPVERELLDGRPPRYVQLATAAAPEGPSSLARWHALGKAAADRIGVEQVVVPVGNRADADDPANAALVAGAGLVYLSGGNPAFLTETLRGTPVWDAIVEAWRAGAALAGCSAGAMALSAGFPGFRRPWRSSPGLGLVPVARVVPHFDRFAARLPDVALRGSRSTADQDGAPVLLGIDEDTAVVGGLPAGGGWQAEPAGPGNTWQVLGRQSAWLLAGSGRIRVPSGSSTVLGAGLHEGTG